MQTDGCPKVYSSEYAEELKLPPPAILQHNNSDNITSKQTLRSMYKSLDGTNTRPEHRELQAFFKQVNSKLNQTPDSNSTSSPSIGIDVLKKHYNSVFTHRKHYKVFVQYFKFDSDGNKRTLDDIYAVRIDKNSLRQIKDKIPHRKANFRYFFKDRRCTCDEEYEIDESEVPYREKDGFRLIQCQVLIP